MNYLKNNLDKSHSPYLKSKHDSPIFWQEWSSDVLAYAQQQNKLILVSVGYATCHWCTVMDNDTFKDAAVAQYLNTHFVSIAVDREERPDIDHYYMSFALKTAQVGGWPLNIVLTPDLKPFVATTYIPAHETKPEGIGFLALLTKAKQLHDEHAAEIPAYQLKPEKPAIAQEQVLIDTIEEQFDDFNGGFGDVPKFPPHATLLFLLATFSLNNKKNIYIMLKKTLDSMAIGGLHDHLQGGFFRYCVDQEWKMPHFEKMLFDQALLLWSYSAAHKVLKEESYKQIAAKIVTCLEETFFDGTLLRAAHDADTHGVQGSTYLWEKSEIESLLTPQEFAEFDHVYELNSDQALPSGKGNLVKSRNVFLPAIEKKLLAARNKRPQPNKNNRRLTAWNSWAGIGLIMAHRYTDHVQALSLAQNIFDQLLALHTHKETVYHSSFANDVQKHDFLEDYAGLLLFATYLHEHTRTHKKTIAQLYAKMISFKKNEGWYESIDHDFISVPAYVFDYSLPTSSSMAELALIRAEILLHEKPQPGEYKEALRCDFLNYATMIRNGYVHIIESPQVINWHNLPYATIQKEGAKIMHSFNGTTTEYETVDALINALQI